MIRLYEAQAWHEQDHVTLSERSTHYLRTVLRANINDHLILFNGQGGEYDAQIIEMNKKHSIVKIIRFTAIERESTLTLHLAQGLTRSDKFDYIVQKATELGVTSITPIIAERSQGRLSSEQAKQKIARLQQIVIAAAEQCGRNRLPRINTPVALKQWLTHTTNLTARYLLMPGNATHSITMQEKPSEVHVLIGPEGGFTPDENQDALENGYLPLTLGPRILRTETASLAAITLLQWQFGDLNASDR